jgi:hypothetical protein
VQPTITARFRRGTITIPSNSPRPTSYTVQYFEPGTNKVARKDTRDFNYDGHGWHFQADEVSDVLEALRFTISHMFVSAGRSLREAGQAPERSLGSRHVSAGNGDFRRGSSGWGTR